MTNRVQDTDQEVTALEVVSKSQVSLGILQADNAHSLVAGATEIATQLSSVIRSQHLSTMIQGKEYVQVEGWTTLATMLGITPREESNMMEIDGSYVATVVLVRLGDGAIVGRASSECGRDEPTWMDRPAYARRSMASTRATGKACRLAFSWVMSLAGYSVTPAEEMPEWGGDHGQQIHQDDNPRRYERPAVFERDRPQQARPQSRPPEEARRLTAKFKFTCAVCNGQGQAGEQIVFSRGPEGQYVAHADCHDTGGQAQQDPLHPQDGYPR